MPIVASFITAHAPGITGYPDAAPPEKKEAVYQAFGDLRARLVAAKPDLIIGVSNDHFSNFLDPMPPFCISVADKSVGPNSDYEGLIGLSCRDYPNHVPYAHALRDHFLSAGFDPATTRAPLKLEDQFPVPLHFLNPDQALPLVPIYLNCMLKPMPSLDRSLAFGKALGAFANAREERVVILATGGLSHWVGTPEEGKINHDFEARVLTALRAGDLSNIMNLTDEDIEEAGNGAHEIRNWLVAVGACQEGVTDVVAHVVVPEWQTGIVLGDISLRNLAA